MAQTLLHDPGKPATKVVVSGRDQNTLSLAEVSSSRVWIAVADRHFLEEPVE